MATKCEIKWTVNICTCIAVLWCKIQKYKKKVFSVETVDVLYNLKKTGVSVSLLDLKIH